MSSRLSLVSSTVIVVIVFAGVTGLLFYSNQYDPPSIAVFAAAPGLDDYGFGNQTEIGIEAVQADMAVYSDPFIITTSDAVARMGAAAGSGRYELIIVIGQEFIDALEEVAASYPAQKFAMMGGRVTGLTNVVSAEFAAHEAAYLAGIAAAHIASQEPYSDFGSVIGILGSFEDDPVVSDMVQGFKNGVIEANLTYGLGVALGPEAYLESANDSANAEIQTVVQFVSDNVSLLFAPLGASIVGVREGVNTVNETFRLYGWDDRMPLVITAGSDLEYYGLPDPQILSGQSWLVTCVLPRSDLAAYTIINATLWNDFLGEVVLEYDLSNDGVDLTSFRFSSTYIDDFNDVIATIEYYRGEIIAGNINPLA